MKTSFIILTYEPTDEMIEFIIDVNMKTSCEGFIVVDNNNYIPPKSVDKYILQMDDNLCYNSGFRNVNFVIKKKITAWDKVLYFLCRVLRGIDFTWIVEDDVFVPNMKSIEKMTNKYSEYDLVTASDTSNKSEKRNFWHWKHMPKYMNNNSLTLSVENIGWYKSMACAIGISRRLLYNINLHAMAYKQLMFLEFMFNTICHQAGLTNTTAPEFEYIVWRKSKKEDNWTQEDVLSTEGEYWFHPIKNRKDHYELHKILNK
jgi:hypothetical protein